MSRITRRRSALRVGSEPLMPPASTEGLPGSAAASGSLHSGQRLAKPGLSGLSSNSSPQTTQVLIGNGIVLLRFYQRQQGSWHQCGTFSDGSKTFELRG